MWIRTAIFVLVWIAVAILLLLGIGLAVVVLIWFWNYKRHQWKRTIKQFIRKILVFVKLMEKEIESDIKYSTREVKKVLGKAHGSPLLWDITTSYWVSVKKIVKRFLTNNHRHN